MPTARDIITGRLNDLEKDIYSGNHDSTHDDITAAIEDLIDAFGWHPIERADEFGLRTVPDGKKWGPRIVVLVKGQNMKTATPHVAYYDPDTDAAHPAPYWRTVGMTAGWSRRNQPTHFIRTYA
jgi:hypothetical protein